MLADLGIDDARRAPIVAKAYHWFGLAPSPLAVDGTRPDLGKQLRGAHSSAVLRALGALSYPIYAFLSNHGELFVPAVDIDEFPPIGRVAATVRFVRWSTQRAFGLHPPDPSMRTLRAQLRGIVDTVRLGHSRARMLSVADSRAVVRSLFLSSSTRIDLLPYLAPGREFGEILRHTGSTHPERLRAWLQVGVELGELDVRDDRYVVRGRRARSIATGDQVLTAHYRSILDYQGGPYHDLHELIRNAQGEGRADLERHADDIAQVSMAATPFIAPFITETVSELHARRILDVGCGTGVYSRIALGTDPDVRVDAIDLAPDVIKAAEEEFRLEGFASRIRLHVGDARRWVGGTKDRFDLVLLMNNIYYFDPATRADLFALLGSVLQPSGQLLVVSMTTPGSVAAAHLDFMLQCQAGAASLPTRADIEADLRASGFDVLERRFLVPTEPFVGIRAAFANRHGRTSVNA